MKQDVSKPFIARVYICHLVTLTTLLIALILPRACLSEEQFKFNVGVILPLTGPAADYGLAIRNSIELAKQDRPELFTNISFHIEDAIHEPRLAVSAFHKLTSVNKVNLLVTFGVSFCKALAPLAESRQVPMVGICIDPTTALNREYVILFLNPIDDFLKLTATYLHNHNKNKLGILLSDHPYLEEVYAALKRHLHEGQSMTIVERLPISAMDVRTLINKLQNSNFDAVGVFLYGGQIPSFYKQAKGMNFTKYTFGTNFFESTSLIEASNGTMNGAVYGNVAVKPAFIKRYEEVYKNNSQLAFGGPAYEFAMVVGELFNDSKAQVSPKQVIRSFAKVSSKPGIAAGPYNYVNDRNFGQYFSFPITMKKVTEVGSELAN